LVTPDKTNEGDEMTSAYVIANFMPDRDEAMQHKDYQKEEFCFNGN
jgi:hypothetical protein